MSEHDLLADCRKDEMIQSMESVLAKIATRLNVSAGDVPGLLEAIGQLDVPLTYEQMDTAMRKVGELTTAREQAQGKVACSAAIEKGAVKALSIAAERIEQLEAMLRSLGPAEVVTKETFLQIRNVLEFAGDTPPDDKFTPCAHCGMVPFTTLLTIHAEGCPQTVEDSDAG